MTVQETLPPSQDTPDLSSPMRTDTLRRTAIGLLLYAGKRLAFGLVVLLSIVYLTYLGLDMAGGTDLGPAAAQAATRTAKYVGRLLHGDLGLTVAGSDTALPRPVGEVILERLPRSLGLLGLALLLATALGTMLGIIAARGRARRSLVILLVTLIGISVPSFFAAFLLQWAVIASTRQIGRSILPVGGFGWDEHLLLPAIVLSARPIAQVMRITFVSVRQALAEDYVRTAHSKGLGRRHVMFVHVMRNVAIPILTTAGVSLRYSLSSLPVVELYFGWTGAGFTLLRGIAQRDDNLTVALVLCLGALFILVNLVLEVSYRLIDPRLRQAPAHVTAGQRSGLWAAIREVAATLLDLLKVNELTRWLARRRGAPSQGKQRQTGTEGKAEGPTDGLLVDRQRRWGAALRSFPLIAGGLFVLVLAVIVLFGPQLTPNNPAATQGLTKVGEQFVSPPFSPNQTYPWGTDALGRGLMSLILAGARQTLMLAVLAVTARTVVGVVLGAIAGWTDGSTLDRLILSLAEIIAAFPTLLLAMILILALGIRKGMPPFIVALCFVGWGEIMQFVRSQVIAIRPRPYVESAVAVGARTPRILGRHILPHLFSALTSIVALEMGSVLMLLGELGFVSIFIGGGTVIAQNTGQLVLHSDVPEWGALLSNLRYMARSYPWTALYPMLAFTVSILSFNLFSEGIRRLLEEGNLVIHRIVNCYTVVLTVVAVVVFRWLNANSGSIPFYQERARAFDGERAMRHVVALTDEAMQGRTLGSQGMDLAADYIAEQFAALKLQSGGQEGTYYQERARAFERFASIPELTVLDGGPLPAYREDYAPFPSPYTSRGEAEGPARFICVGEQLNVQSSVWRPVYVELERADFSGQILLVPSELEAEVLNYRPQGGLLVIASDPTQIARQTTVGGRPRSREFPRLWVSDEVAERLLHGSGHTLPDLRERCASMPAEGVFELALPTHARVSVSGEVEDKWPVRHVIGYIPGTHSYDYCYDCLGKQLIVVMVQYDSPPIGPDGSAPPGANDNASGIAVMLEAIRVIQETDYEPYKSMLFVAYSGEGLEGGEIASHPDVKRFLQARPGISKFELEAIIELRGVGTASGRKLEIAASGSLRLAELAERAARHVGVRSVRAEETIDIGVVYDERSAASGPRQEAPTVRLFWTGWEERSRTPDDGLDNVSSGNLGKAGQALAMALMILGREREY